MTSRRLCLSLNEILQGQNENLPSRPGPAPCVTDSAIADVLPGNSLLYVSRQSI
ncbi:rCG25063 [Rattus norvegicus]|uniref:RCG25063 n=1 Tax=Rattus norvegicus TaxID=10116 RepID=A6I3I6_RAT|nr:rCG25063 [Rattus norvegicus]